MQEKSQTSLVVRSWPLLLSTEAAAQFLSLDQESFWDLTERLKLRPVDTGGGELRWQRRDIEKAVSQLPKIDISSTGKSAPRIRSLDDASIDKIAAAVAIRLNGTLAQSRLPELVSLKEACLSLGVGRSTMYRLINTGRIKVKHIGRRTLIPRAEIEKIQVEGS